MIQEAKTGYRLPDSSLWRDWCCVCGGPMRIVDSQLGFPNVCTDCNRHRPPDLSENLTPRQRSALLRQED